MSKRRRDGQQLMHWCKNGDLVIKNKIKDTILRENLHEERSLDSTLGSLNKHQSKEERHLINKRLQFAKRREKSLAEKKESQFYFQRQRSFSDGDVHLKHGRVSHKRNFNAKVKWQKAITVVRFAVQSKAEKKFGAKTGAGTFLPRIVQAKPNSSPGVPRKQVNDNNLLLPRIKSSTTEDTKNCMKDPRFLRLQEILCLSEDKKEKKVSSGETTRDKDPERLRSQTFHL
ncbi:uncharacterized protein LOC114518203 [Dendronephthya gigantea]|uniref:uncharacterized protein LOC114518203 n=1 Tax=Dendronephthya gigantea TaxID=151771 RepID=UPI00106A9507|nr:uncharacterized protein LOC114518203 [Dendronephthya gigantea]